MQYADKENKTIMCHFLVPMAEKQSTTKTRNINNTTDFINKLNALWRNRLIYKHGMQRISLIDARSSLAGK